MGVKIDLLGQRFGREVFVCETPKAIVRIHPGKLTEEERKETIQDATNKYLRAVWAAKNKKSAQA